MYFKNDRGYRAMLVVRNEDRVIYHAWDEKGEQIQNNGCRSPDGFDREWRHDPSPLLEMHRRRAA